MGNFKLITETSTHYCELAPAVLRLNDFDACFSFPFSTTLHDYVAWKDSLKDSLYDGFNFPFHYSITLSVRSRVFIIEICRDLFYDITVYYREYKFIS